jgi:endonuclease/exonuclease/phosphatase (EEP) superfamily protein YafD
VTEQFKNNVLQSTLSTILFVGTGFVLLSPQVPIIRKVSEYSVHIMLGMLVFSMLAMVLGKSKVMFAGLACTAAICIFLKNASLDTLNYSVVNTECKLNVAHINLGNIPLEIEPILEMLEAEKIDIVSFQELTPDWHDILVSEMPKKFPYFKSEERVDFYGLAVYSRLPLKISATFLCEGIPNLNVVIEKENKEFQIISSYLTPALDHKSLIKAAQQLSIIADQVNNSDRPLIALGEYNMVYWTNEIRNFRAKTNLQNSRRDLVDGNLRVPYDHIFFSDELECTQFKELKDVSQNYLGIMGSYQIKKDDSKYQSAHSQLSLND